MRRFGRCTQMWKKQKGWGGGGEKDTVLVKSCGKKFLRESIFADWLVFVFAGTNFCDFHKVPEKSLMIFSFLLSTCNGNTHFQTYYGVRTLCKTSTTDNYFIR